MVHESGCSLVVMGLEKYIGVYSHIPEGVIIQAPLFTCVMALVCPNESYHIKERRCS